jgi:hypothetical protein
VALTFCNPGRHGEISSVSPCLETQLKPEYRSMKLYFAHTDSAQREQTSRYLFESIVHSTISCRMYADTCRRGGAPANVTAALNDRCDRLRWTSSARLFDGTIPRDGLTAKTALAVIARATSIWKPCLFHLMNETQCSVVCDTRSSPKRAIRELATMVS